MIRVRDFPGFVLLMLAGAALMLIPAVMGAALGTWEIARVFLYHAVFFTVAAMILGLATVNRVPRIAARYHLVTILLTYLLLPAMLAAPFQVLVPGLGFGSAYFEMLSSLTTTGATLFDRPETMAAPLHLWRALVGWVGGLMVLVIAFAILAPLNLGGFEFTQTGASHREGRRSATIEEAGRRISRFSRVIAPLYALCTGILTLVLVFAGDTAFVALCHAMGTLSTSGISPLGGLADGRSGRLGEVAIAVMLLPAVSHRVLNYDQRRRRGLTRDDPQFRLMLVSVLGVTLVLFLRAYVGAAEIERQSELGRSLQAIWGGFFTSLSFLTTTGYESSDWRTMQLWSNLPAPGTILMGLAVMGGGVATTAGGVKLLRIYALYRHGLREMDLLTHPSAMIRMGRGERLISRDGARIAFIFLMLFLIAIALAMLGLAMTGLAFETSLAFAIAALTNTGPVANGLGEGVRYSGLSDVALAILCGAMIVGRMETLVIVALFNPAFWRR